MDSRLPELASCREASGGRAVGHGHEHGGGDRVQRRGRARVWWGACWVTAMTRKQWVAGPYNRLCKCSLLSARDIVLGKVF